MMKTVLKNKRLPMRLPWLGLLLGILVSLPLTAFADPSLRYQRTSNRVERRGGRSENRIERRDVRSENRIENRDERSGNRIERRDVRSENRIERRDTRITNRIERRDYLLSPPAGSTRVAVDGVNYYRSGETYYKPEFYEGKAIYVPADVE